MLHVSKKAAAGLGLVAAIALAGCQGEPTVSTAENPATTAAPTAQTAAYLCPMACEGSASQQPGKCPVCGMDLEPNPAVKTGAAAPDSL
ncbi:heavy metal-binding domain-containing protein [Hymenobacter guriensis]|uniref:Heavy metal binding domain-containing protein n=1 Tax=Hymenobacter guriensis TaxID=2793065 RepID=A0ABS0L532_9BACT|nr:heavy metal-binding domain-containing protein [Hymenobacter guriensis]MBG8555250.1 hypothetical protein [Hymenobacter guriensis]